MNNFALLTRSLQSAMVANHSSETRFSVSLAAGTVYDVYFLSGGAVVATREIDLTGFRAGFLKNHLGAFPDIAEEGRDGVALMRKRENRAGSLVSVAGTYRNSCRKSRKGLQEVPKPLQEVTETRAGSYQNPTGGCQNLCKKRSVPYGKMQKPVQEDAETHARSGQSRAGKGGTELH